MARKEFTEDEIAILKTSPHVMEVSPAIIHFNVAFKELFWRKFQAGMNPADIFREAGIDPDMLGKTRVEGFKGMLKAEIKKGPVPERTGPISVQFSQMITAGRDRG